VKQGGKTARGTSTNRKKGTSRPQRLMVYSNHAVLLGMGGECKSKDFKSTLRILKIEQVSSACKPSLIRTT